MTLLKRCAAIINHRSGHRHGVHAYTDSLKQYMDRAGIIHHDIHIPNDDVAEHLRRALPNAEALVLCGGDGTVNSTVNLLANMATSSAPAHLSSSSPSFSPSLLEATPLLLVPTGLHNSIATSLGVATAQRAVSSLVVGRTVAVPLWAVHLHSPTTSVAAAAAAAAAPATTAAASPPSSTSPPLASTPVRYMCSYVAAGTYASIVRRQARWKEAQEDYVSMPSLLGTRTATSLYTTLEHASPHCSVTVAKTKAAAEKLASSPVHGMENALHECAASPPNAVKNSDLDAAVLRPLRMVVAAQMPQLQPGYSLTPVATYHQHTLTVTTATDDVTRMRMWHLLRREAREGYILPEDGVVMQEGVQGLRLAFPPARTDGVDERVMAKSEKAGEVDDGAVAAEDDDTALLVIDGECVRVPHGSVVTVTPTQRTALFIVS